MLLHFGIKINANILPRIILSIGNWEKFKKIENILRLSHNSTLDIRHLIHTSINQAEPLGGDENYGISNFSPPMIITQRTNHSHYRFFNRAGNLSIFLYWTIRLTKYFMETIKRYLSRTSPCKLACTLLSFYSHFMTQIFIL